MAGKALRRRKEAHSARQRVLREKKRHRKAVGAAIAEATRMKRSRKKGTGDLIANMRTLGWAYDSKGQWRRLS